MKTTDIRSTSDLLSDEPPLSEVLWFSHQDKNETKRTIERLSRRRISKLKLGLDCTEFNSKNGKKWYDWLIPTLSKEFQVAVCLDNFSKSGQAPKPVKRSLAQIVEHVIFKHGSQISGLELWRNPVNRSKFTVNVFSEDVVFAATWAKHLGKKVSLGVIRELDGEWISTLRSSQFMSNIDFVEIVGAYRSYLPAIITDRKLGTSSSLPTKPHTGQQGGSIAC